MSKQTAHEIKKRLRFGLTLLPALRKIALSYYQKKIKIELKDNLSEVSIADKKCEQFLRKKIKEKFPKDGIIGEEFPEKNSSGEFTWTLDPIDGTFSFVRGNPFFGSMMGLMYQDKSVMGIVDFPALRQCIYASQDNGAYFQASTSKIFKRCNLSKKNVELKEALFCHTGSEIWNKFNLDAQLDNIRKATRYERTWGDCYGYYLLATGQCEVMADPKLAIWDLIPIQVICKEAGAKFFGLDGIDSINMENAIAFLPQFENEISKLLHWTNLK